MSVRNRIDYILIILGSFDDIINPEETFNSLGFDSLDFAELIIEVEAEFKIHIPTSEINTRNTVNDLYSLTEKKLLVHGEINNVD